MKKVCGLLIALTSAMYAQAQINVLYHGSTVDKIYSLKEAVQKEIGTTYHYCGYSDKKMNFLFMDTSRNAVTISYSKTHDLIDEVQLVGKYDQLFPFWKRYIDPTADPIKTKTDSQKKVIQQTSKNDIVIEFIKGDDWEIRLRSY